jgi:hypothetical protein
MNLFVQNQLFLQYLKTIKTISKPRFKISFGFGACLVETDNMEIDDFPRSLVFRMFLMIRDVSVETNLSRLPSVRLNAYSNILSSISVFHLRLRHTFIVNKRKTFC